MKIIFFLFFFNIIAFSNVIINEFMPVPEGSEPEWVELFNNSNSNFHFSKIYIADAATSKLLPEFDLKPYNFAVISKDTALLKTIRKIPDSTKLIQITLPSLNNNFDSIILRTDSLTIDSVYYHSSFGENGKSIERISSIMPAISKENLTASIDKDGATCGFANSVIRYEKDIAIKYIRFENFGKMIVIQYDNYGELPIANFDFILFVDLNNDNVFEDSEIIFDVPNILAENGIGNYSHNIESIADFPKFSTYLNVKAVINSEVDLNKNNDSLITELYFSSFEPSLTINEIMYDTDDTTAEFIEIYNNGSNPINLKNGEIKDDATKSKTGVKILNDFIIEPNNFALIIWDSLFFINHQDLLNSSKVFYSKNSSFNLNQTGDYISISDANGFIFDSLTYSNDWHTNSIDTKNTSLEKINHLASSQLPSSWATSISVSKSTPLEKNSVFADINSNIKLTASPNPFSPSGSEKQFCIIGYNLPFDNATLTASIYDTQGKKIKDIANNIEVNKIGSLVWDGKNENGYNISVGRYVLLMNAFDNNSDNQISERIVIVIGN